MNRKMKISLVGTLIAGTALCVALPLASCASTEKVYVNEKVIIKYLDWKGK